MAELLNQQLTDVFRIGLIIALVFTMLRTRAQTGILVPLAAGVLFVAVIIPATIPNGNGVALWQQVGIGVIANAILLAVMGAVLLLWQRFRG